jgi:hypothetical protein
MKKALSLIFLAAILTCCSGFDTSVELTHTGCVNDTKGSSDDNDDPLLYLEQTSAGLAITRMNTYFNCIIRKSDNPLVCDVQIDGSDIYYSVYEREEPTLNCICLVKRVSSTITGLQNDKEYVLHYLNYIPINFRYHKGLKLTFNLEDYEQ